MQKIIKEKIKVIIMLLGLVFPCIALRFFYIQIIQHAQYSEMANRNLDKYNDILPRRGAVYDRTGSVLLAKTSPSYNVYLRFAKLVDTSLFSVDDFKDPSKLVEKLRDATQSTDSVSSYLKKLLSENFQHKINVYKSKEPISKEFLEAFAAELNNLLETFFYRQPIFADVSLPKDIKVLISKEYKTLTRKELMKCNRILLENAYPKEIEKRHLTQQKEIKDFTQQFIRYHKNSITNLSQMLNIPSEEILQKVGKIHQKVDKDIENEVAKKVKEHNVGNKKSKIDRIRLNIAHDYYNRKYLLFNNVSYDVAQTMEVKKFSWRTHQDKTEIVDEFQGFEVESSVARQYPSGSFAPQLLGNIEILDENKIKRYPQEKEYRKGDMAGRAGLERLAEDILRGKRGVKVDSRQKEYVFFEKPMDGMDLILTMDAKHQQVAEQALDEMLAKTSKATGGAAVVIDIYTGEIIVLACSPRYDNNNYSKEYGQLLKAPENPLLNRSISYGKSLPPGSVFKVAVALYALEKGLIDQNTTVVCRGCLNPRTPRRFRCTHVHGEVNVVKAIEGSCNVFFYKVGETMGPEMLAECARMFGYGEKSGLGLSRESPGRVPTPEWKFKVTREKWGDGNSRMFGIGQMMEATPIQVASAMTMVATGGSMPELKIIKEYRAPISAEFNPQFLPANGLMVSAPADPKSVHIIRQIPFSQKSRLLVLEGMQKVVDGRYGTAQALAKSLGDLKIASKTGTSQVANGEDHAWFAGFAPLHDPKYAFAVVIEHGGYGGSVAGPVAVKILKSLFP